MCVLCEGSHVCSVCVRGHMCVRVCGVWCVCVL